MLSQGRNGLKHISMLAVFGAMAMICSYIEILIPFSFGIPGVKLGLPNLVTLILLYIGREDGDKIEKGRLFDAGIVLLIRIVLVSLLFTNLYSMLYSLAGGVCSLFIMWFFSGCGKISVIGCSILGGITHDLAQLAVAIAVVAQLKVVYYLPVLLLAGTLTGLLLGITAKIILNRRGVLNAYDRFFER
ncbi:MAG: Gx transporter family protein [Lachnospiraceae bacterium]|nr:Gx transporter family protein [Lachnospiraceae bacterium]